MYFCLSFILLAMTITTPLPLLFDNDLLERLEGDGDDFLTKHNGNHFLAGLDDDDTTIDARCLISRTIT